MKLTKANRMKAIKTQKTLNGLLVLTIVFLVYGCLGPYANDQITFIMAMLNILKLTGITLIGYIGLTLGNYLLRVK